jgi:hypothetical protein
MPKFKNRFAVTGDIIELLKFERELLKLGYKNVYGKRVFDYRGESGNEALFITVGSHMDYSLTGTFIPAMNNGDAPKTFKLPEFYPEAWNCAKELKPVFTTEDGKEMFNAYDNVYGARPLQKDEDIRVDVYKGWYVEKSTRPISLTFDKYGWKWFSSSDARTKYIDQQSPILVTEDGVPKFLGDQLWYVRPDLTYHFWKSGLQKSYANTPQYKYFNTEAGCLKYIDQNKKQFSKKDIEEAILANTITNVLIQKGFGVSTNGVIVNRNGLAEKLQIFGRKSWEARAMEIVQKEMRHHPFPTYKDLNDIPGNKF